MLLITLRKMFTRIWLMLCLLIGLIIAVSLVASVPIYINASLQRMLLKDLEDYQMKTGKFPGGFSLKIGLGRSSYGDSSKEIYQYLDNKIGNEMVYQFGLPVLCASNTLSINNLMVLDNNMESTGNTSVYTSLEAVSGLEKFVDIAGGRFFSDKKADGAYEVIVTSKAMENLGLVMDHTYKLKGLSSDRTAAKIKVVGVFSKNKSPDNAWMKNDLDFAASMLMDYDLFKNEFDSNFIMVEASEWNYSLDYRQIQGSRLESILSADDSHRRLLNRLSRVELNNNMVQTVQNYVSRKRELLASLWVLLTPVFIMLGFYIFMVSKMVLDSERNEIAVFKSRGGNRRQIIGIYAIQGLILSVIAIGCGPVLALRLCGMLGSANGFMEFIGRKALPVTLGTDAYIFSLAVLALFFLTILIPAISASGINIVEHKQRQAGENTGVFWKKAFLDIICLGMSIYGYLRYSGQTSITGEAGVGNAGAAVDPVLFLSSALCIIGLGLLFIRIFPYIIRLLFVAGKRYWTPGMYASIIGLTRSNGQEQFIILFITLTVAVGFFNANSARTINRNIEDQIRYQTGADIKLLESDKDNGIDKYFSDLDNDIPGIEGATRVFDSGDVSEGGFGVMSGSTTIEGASILGVIPHEFASIAWYREGLLPHHMVEYLNIMQDSPKAMLLSSVFKNKYNFEKGDIIYVQNAGNEYVEGIVYEFVDYWPTFKDYDKGLVIANLSYLEDMGLDRDCEYWISKKAGAQDTPVFNMLNQKIDFYKQFYADDIIRKAKNDPKIQGTNGILTLGFIITIVISMIGFAIYCVLSINSRILQFGVLRAMGLNSINMIAMILFEQVLISGTSIIAGFFIGHFTGYLFIPIIDAVSNVSGQIIPPVITYCRDDYIKIYIGIGSMLLLGFVLIARIITRIRMTQAIKLGED